MFFFFCIVGLVVSCHCSQNTHPKFLEGISPVPFESAHAPGGRIIGGEPTTINEYPFAVSIQYNGTDLNYEVAHFCGGSIISEEWILTSARCVLFFDISTIHVRVGSDYFHQNGTIHGIDSFIVHPDHDEILYDYDIGLLKLSEALQLSSTVGAVALPWPDRTIINNTEVTIAGWGTTEFFGYPSPQINHAVVLTITNELCATVYGNDSVTDRMFCTYTEGTGSCIGDSGTPIVEDGVIVGLVSWSYACTAYGYPNVQANIPRMVDWITEVTGILPTNGALRTTNYSTFLILISILVGLR